MRIKPVSVGQKIVKSVQKAASNHVLSTIAQSTTAALVIETTLKAIGRPGFILIDKDIKPETKKYAATKEFIYQATCLAVYMAVIVPLFKKGGFNLAKKIFKDEPGFKYFNNLKEYLDYNKLAKKSAVERRLSLMKNHKSGNKSPFVKELQDELRKPDKANSFPIIKGAVELSNIIGSVCGLAILAPQISHATIHPILRAIGLEEKKKKEEVKQ